MTTLERAMALLFFLGAGGLFWAHTKEKKEAELVIGGVWLAAVLLYLNSAAVGD